MRYQTIQKRPLNHLINTKLCLNRTFISNCALLNSNSRKIGSCKFNHFQLTNTPYSSQSVRIRVFLIISYLYFNVTFTMYGSSTCSKGIPERQYEIRREEKDNFLGEQNLNKLLVTLKYHMRITIVYWKLGTVELLKRNLQFFLTKQKFLPFIIFKGISLSFLFGACSRS